MTEATPAPAPKPKPKRKRSFAYSGQMGGPSRASLERSLAYRRLFAGTGSRQDADIVLVDLTVFTGLHRRPSFHQWEKEGKSAEDFLLHSALSNARVETLLHITDILDLSDDVMIAMERAAKLEAARLR